MSCDVDFCPNLIGEEIMAFRRIKSSLPGPHRSPARRRPHRCSSARSPKGPEGTWCSSPRRVVPSEGWGLRCRRARRALFSDHYIGSAEFWTSGRKKALGEPLKKDPDLRLDSEGGQHAHSGPIPTIEEAILPGVSIREGDPGRSPPAVPSTRSQG